MVSDSSYIKFIRTNAAFLSVGALLLFLSSFGQTFFIAVFAGEIRSEFSLTNGDWGLIYMIGTAASAVAMVFAGTLTDVLRVRVLAIITIGLLAISCFVMAVNPYGSMLVFVIFALRFFGQGMANHISIVATARWFIATRGQALAICALGLMLAEAVLPLTFVWLKAFLPWRYLWVGCAIFALFMIPILLHLLKFERIPQMTKIDTNAAGMNNKHWTRAEALRHPLFWSLAPAISLFPTFVTAFWFHQVHFAEVKEWDHLNLVVIFPLGTISFMVSTFLYGWMIDQIGVRRLLPLYMLPLALAFIVHSYAPIISWSAFGVILMGLAGGGQATLPTAFWTTYFGTAHIGAIKSVATAMIVLGSAIGPGLSGWLIDVGIGFEQQMIGYAALLIGGSLGMIIPLRKATKKLTITL